MKKAAIHDVTPEVEEFRDARWCREGARQVDSVGAAERFIERVGFAASFTDARRPGPSLYVAVCGRRDAVLPRHVQKDEETSLAWRLKDEMLARGRVYYGKLARGRPMFLAPRLIPHFHAIWGVRPSEERGRLSEPARAVLKALRKEWEIATTDLRTAAGLKDRRALTAALDELQAAMIVVPSSVFYGSKFTYLWTLAIGRFPDALRVRVDRDAALKEIARAFLDSAGATLRGELARVTGLSRRDAGRGNQALVSEGYAFTLSTGVYQLAALRPSGPVPARERAGRSPTSLP